MEITRVILGEGVNKVGVPVDGTFLSVQRLGDGAAALAYLAPRSPKLESRTFYVARTFIEDDVPLGDYLGCAQEQGGAAMHVFEVGEKKPKAKK